MGSTRHEDKITIKYFDRTSRRLVYIRRGADSAYWEDHWGGKDDARITSTTANRFFVTTTARHLPLGSRVLDGGCGMADKVFALHAGGFAAFGVDFAVDTLVRARRIAPSLKLIAADVTALPFRDGSLDGCWSIGVIEHSFEGFQPIAAEIRRVLRPGGILFLTFPVFSPVRRLKASLGLYGEWSVSGNSGPKDFYQFALSPDPVAETFFNLGFTLLARVPRGGMRGLKEEMPRAHGLARLITRAGGPLRRTLRDGIDRMVSRSVGHTMLLVLRRDA